MRKILSFFAAMLVAVAVNAAPVVLPATLDVSNVSFRSDGMPDFVIPDGEEYAGTYFDMGAHDSSNDTLLYAEWEVAIEPIKYNIAVDVYNTNSWRVQLHLLTLDGDTVKDLRFKGSSGKSGQFSIGTMDMSDLAAGNYKLRARAATAWSAMKLKDVIFEADYQGVNVELPGTLTPAYALLSANASISGGAIAFKPSTAPDEYATWNVSFADAGDFNVSIDITASNGHNYGVALLSADGLTEIGAVDEGGQKSDTGEKELGSISVPAAGNYIVKLTNAIQWSEAVLNSITFAGASAGPVVEYYLVSNMRGWDPDDANKFEPNPGVDGEFVLSTFLYLNEEVKGVKVVDGVVAEWIPAGDNLKIDHAHAGDVDIYFRPEGNLSWPWFFVWIDVTDPLFPDGFYLISEDWTMNGLIGKFDENPSTPGEYMFGAWTVEGSKLKVVYVENFAIKDWYPAGTENEYVVDAAHAGAVTVYFNPTYNSEWSEFGGFMYIPGSVVPLTAPDDAPAAPTSEPYQVRAVYSDTYGADCNFGEWGSGTAYTQEAFGKKFVTSGLGYFGLEFPAMNCSEMEALHLDVWIADDATIRVVPIHGGTEVGVTVTLIGQQWNPIEIPLESFEGVTDWSNVYQIKIDNAPELTFWLNNVYFFTTKTKTLDLEDGYYLIGLNGWDEYSLSAADKLEINPGDASEYMVFTNLAIGDEFKVVKVESNAITTWFPDGAKPNYVVDYAHAGDITVYFRPDYSGASDWHEACIYVPKNADANPFWTWFAIGDSWTEEFDSYLDWDPVNHVAAVHINIDKYGQWRAQVKYQGPAAEEGKCYRLSLKMKANNNLDNVTVKYQDNAEMIYNPGISLLAGEEFVFDETAAGVAGGNGILVLDFGFAKTGDIIEIYDVVLEEVECPSPEIDINISKGVELYDMIANYGLWQIYANDADYELSLVAYSSALEGTITEADLYEDASYVYLYDIAAEALIEIATLDMTVTANADGSVDFVGKMLGGDGKLYNLNIHYGAVVEVTREIAISEYELMDYRPYSMGWVVVGENAEEGIDIQLIINSEADSPDGDYTLADLNTDYYIIKETVGEEESYPAVFSADIHIETTAAGRIITADLLCTNNVLYKVTLYKAPGTISREYFAENIETWEDNTAEAAGWQLVVMDEEYAFSFQAVEGVDRVDGTFNFGVELDDYYSYIVTLPSYNFYDFTELIGVGVQNADKSIDFTFNGKGTDLNTYNIIVHVPAPTPTAIENSNVENETVKTIENGQLRIRHNGKIFNANGARIK